MCFNQRCANRDYVIVDRLKVRLRFPKICEKKNTRNSNRLFY
jgi:hypothetical protein